MSLIKKTAEDLGVDEVIVGKVISSAYEEVTKALKVHNTVELSGFGLLFLSHTKVAKHIPNYEIFLDKCKKEQMDNPSPKNYDRVQQVEEMIKNLKFRYEQITGKAFSSLEGA